MANTEQNTNKVTDNEWAILDVKNWIGIQIGDYRSNFRKYIDSKDYQTVDELKQEAENYMKSNPLILTANREESKDEIEQWKDLVEDRIAIYGENITSNLEEEHTELLEDMSTEELDGLISYNIEFFNTYPIDTIDLTETT